MQAMQILIANDRKLVRKGLRAVLENQPAGKVCWKVVNAQSTL
jgi:DNA-binding NarL/FixJ family response regulator